jgi:alpha-L-fucosidase
MKTSRRFSLILPLLFLSLLVLPSVSSHLCAQDFLHESKIERDKRMAWWREARFGLFIHWGLYSVPAGEWKGKNGYGEWIRTSAEIPLEQYNDFVKEFNPVKFNAAAWVKMAKEAGMKYIVITSKHHDGFCLFDTKYTDFNIMSTPFHHDPLQDLAAECRKNGIKLCFYHSIMDWHHPDYLPRREWEAGRSSAGADFARYVGYMKNELKELLTNYGDLGVLWFDGEWESTWNHTEGNDLYNYVRSLQPNIIVNNRVGAGRTGMAGMNAEGEFAGDYGTPEQEIPATGLPDVDWETCMTMNDHWGYNKADTNFKSSAELIRNLVDIVSKGGNYLLNVGPTAEGLFPERSVQRLRDIGAWMKINSEPVYGTKSSPFSSIPWGRCTEKIEADGRVILYLHIFNWPADNRLILAGLGSAPVMNSVHLLGVQDAFLRLTQSSDTTIIVLPLIPHDTTDAVVAMEFTSAPLVFHTPAISAPAPLFVDSIKITMSDISPGTEAHFSLDGSAPSLSSPRYDAPFMITKSATVSARLFYRNKPVSAIRSAYYNLAMPEPAAPAPDIFPGIQYSYYEGDWDSLPRFDQLKPVLTDTTQSIGVQVRKRDEYFGLKFSGYLLVPETAVYRFDLTSDDGSRCYIGERMVVDNNGLHGAALQSGFAPLAKGLHPLRVDYFNKTGGKDCLLSVTVPGHSIESSAVKFFFSKH